MGVSAYIHHTAAFFWGVITLVYLTFLSFLDHNAGRCASGHEQTELLRHARHKIWSLEDHDALPGLHHHFLRLTNGLQLHYVSNEPRAPATSLVVFLHGFPDSWFIFHRFLSSKTLQATGAQLVALDLPGFGGSEDPHGYGPDEMLNTIVKATTQLKERYLDHDDVSNCVLVGHDWGGLIAYRIAAETVGLVERLVVINTAYMPLVRDNASTAISDCHAHLTAWLRNPTQVTKALSAWRSVTPLLTQFLKFGYIFMFHLPYWILTAVPSRLRSYLLEWCHRNGHHRLVNGVSAEPAFADLLAESRASSFGPSNAECATHSENGMKYGASVLARFDTEPPGDWLQRIRLYREGLASGEWTLAPGLRQYACPPTSDAQNFKCPMSVIFGLQDAALDPRMVLDGIERYFSDSAAVPARNGDGGERRRSTAARPDASHIIRLSRCGHWSLLEKPVGYGTLEKTLMWSLSRHGDATPYFGLDETLSHNTFSEEITMEIFS